jgi:hypothetical protein
MEIELIPDCGHRLRTEGVQGRGFFEIVAHAQQHRRCQ